MIQRALLSVFAIILLLANLVKAQGNIEVPFYTKGPLMYVDVELNGRTHTFLFDTGASNSIISVAFAKELGLTLDKETRVRSFGGIQKAYDVVIPELNLGTYTRHNVSAMAVPNVTSGQDDYIGVIGAEFLKDVVLSINYDKEELTFGSKPEGNDKESIKIPIVFGGGLPLVDVRLHDKENHWITGRMIIDTGADAYLLFNPEAEKKYGYSKSFKQKVEEVTQSPAGEFLTILGRSAGFGMGKIELDGVPLKVIAPNENTGEMPNDLLGFIGNKLLSRYNITFDGINNQLYLTPNWNTDTPIYANLVGFKFMANRDMNFVLMHLVENGTAARAGLISGDVITLVNGRKASQTNIDEFLSLFSDAGNEIEITYSRNQEVRQTKMVVTDIL